MAIKTSLSFDESVFNIALSGNFDIHQSLKMQDIIESVPDTVKYIRVDMQNIGQIETAIFSTLLLLYRENESSRKLEIFNCSKSLVQRLTLAGLNRLINIRMSEESFIKSSESDETDIQTPKQK